MSAVMFGGLRQKSSLKIECRKIIGHKD
jgi:hypothetical protein